MTKTLYLVRHAKASDSVSPDIVRPLTSSGMIDTARMGRNLSTKISQIDLIITSNAERTQMTTKVLCEQLGIPEEKVYVLSDLYESSPKHYLDAVNAIPANLNHVMIVGHNPSISYFAEYLTHADIGAMPTCAVVGMKIENQAWAEVGKKSGDLIFYDSPESILGYNS
ncbi:histidine phosphatase family protein [Arcicella sp. DC2W]|uniref:Histidine phosphatase family protein n=1 Tax=Arcicella gelida TaxID=2984195 RepID=A0ABU5S053_9BACT|nr:histidine phosphatase family protein [Arcicella sp. DC2W]MEA5401771.1 histidine phosphatase family protein [Arcicella sp. DC2W]|eukprot:GDKJ01017679.1.p1 GENE.GDKJ01017679.1~~GDKJ01017679.1.p1  ORF type:complete len:168 (-),score=13.94 GDKJ01017679.1:86-589(-)